MPVLFVPKKDVMLLFCIEYRKLRSMMLKDTYPLPRINAFIDTLGDAEYFTTFDAYCRYWQIKISQQHLPRMEFVFHAGAFECSLMSFELTTAASCCQRALDVKLTTYKWETFLVYLVDVIIFYNNLSDHIKQVNEILVTLTDAGVTLKITKCHFSNDKLNI